jgi:SAM-dependent methyltransferase
MKARPDWHRSFFRNSFYNPASAAAAAHAPAEAAFVLRQLELKKGAALLDLCCGPGRHAVKFAGKGLAVTGFDFSAEYLAEAEARAKKKRVALRLLRGDMRRLPFRAEFDAAVNLFTSFGYFLKFSEDIATLRGVARALRPGGLFLLDIINGAYIRKHFRARYWENLPGHFLLEETEMTADGLHSTWTRLPKKGGKAASRTFFTRLYDRDRLSAALGKAGLRPVKFFGGFSGEPLSDESVRLICLAKKD